MEVKNVRTLNYVSIGGDGLDQSISMFSHLVPLVVKSRHLRGIVIARLVADWPNNRFLFECNCLGLVKIKSSI